MLMMMTINCHFFKLYAEILGTPPQPDDDEEMEEVAVEEEEEGGSPSGEVPQVETGDSASAERLALAYAATPEARYGNYIVS